MSCGVWQHQRAIRSQYAVNLQSWAMGYLSGLPTDKSILEGTILRACLLGSTIIVAHTRSTGCRLLLVHW
jgi:hypothetical protein